jgi:heat shock protein HtpX
MNIYEHISSNTLRSWLLIIIFVAFVLALAYLFAQVTGYPELLPLAFLIAVISVVGSYYYSDRLVLTISKARPATKEEYAHLVNSVEGLALAAGIPVPRIYVIDDTAPNAFATGRDPQHAVIAVTKGLIQKLNRVEIEGVIAHEMAHIKNYDMRLLTLVAVLAGTIVLISDWIMRGFGRGISRGRRRTENPIIVIVAIFAAVIAPFIATVIRLAISRSREFLADAQGAMLTRYPEGLASALEKIAADTEPLEVANKATAHMYIVNPLKDISGVLNTLFSTHPPIEERIRRLREM